MLLCIHPILLLHLEQLLFFVLGTQLQHSTMSDTCECLCHSTVQDVDADVMLGRTLSQHCTLSTKTDLLAVLLMIII